MKFRDRIRELRRVPASQLRPNPKNWRKHPQHQVDALRAILSEIGFAGAELAFPADGLGADGNFDDLMLIDGHARQEIAVDEVVPVLVTDLTAEEADKVLATFDPLAELAERDSASLENLARDIEFDSASLRRLLDDLLSESEADESAGSESASATGNRKDIELMNLQPEEHYDAILVVASNVNDWNRLVSLFELPDIQAERSSRRVGLLRAVRAEKVLGLIDG